MKVKRIFCQCFIYNKKIENEINKKMKKKIFFDIVQNVTKGESRESCCYSDI